MTPRPSTTPVTADDRVSDVLARGLALIDVFERHSPHFAKLRNAGMRHTMAKLVTVEQAARIAGVPAESLVYDLNAALGIETAPPGGVAGCTSAATAAQKRPRSLPTVELDFRDDLRNGREPFSRIMAAVSALAEGEMLQLRTIFEPAPLFAVLAKRGFEHETEAHAADDWSTWFWRSGAGDSGAEIALRHADATDSAPAAPADETWLDVRGLEPPEPMVRTLAALETMPEGHTLVQVNVRAPQFLLPILAERGFEHQLDESQPDRVLVRIRRRA